MDMLNARIGRGALLGVSLAILSSGSAAALEYAVDKPMAFVYSENGVLYGCGPVQCLWGGTSLLQTALEYLSLPRHGYWYKIGDYGRCSVFQADGYLEPYDTWPDYIASRIQSDC